MAEAGARSPLTDRVFAFEELKAAMDYLKSDAPFGKVCIRHSRGESACRPVMALVLVGKRAA
ncbi:MAG: hypothetical protein DVS81_03530 [Candidatus Accumulibacter meliphilus]|jgi:molybdopterin synthase catalytic subunit|uniref:Alcohol dehydrogenase n=1 Tax=Candidatus Accumulibacter meliphilus TaxID=2211374 RepID=A0A369XV00_9PROT|nr:MAG: hypothetical protein DVS81_03530 [Candidatus Accumulibacter meliphilus]